MFILIVWGVQFLLAIGLEVAVVDLEFVVVDLEFVVVEVVVDLEFVVVEFCQHTFGIFS